MPKTATTLLFALSLCGCSVFSAGSSLSAQDRRVRLYVNCDYGYRVRLPPGLLARVPEYQNHGFFVDLPDGKSRISVSNSYNMSDSFSPSKVFDYELRIDAKIHSAWKILSRRNEQIKGLPGVRVTTTHRHKGSLWKSQSILLYRPPESEGIEDPVYIFELSAPARLYKNALPQLNKVLDGLELMKMPVGPCSND